MTSKQQLTKTTSAKEGLIMGIFNSTDEISKRTNHIRRTRYRNSHKRNARKGAIVPLFAILLPVLLVFCGFAINLAYMQVVTTELKIATDCAAHAGGRAMSVAQDTPNLTAQQKRDLAVQTGINKATEVAGLNTILGRQLSVGEDGSDSEVEIGFGSSVRANNGFGMYEYTEADMADVLSGDSRPSSLHVVGNISVPMIFRVMSNTSTADAPARNITGFSPERRSVATQVNRDVALVLDRSGSMLYFRDEEMLEETIDELYDTTRRFSRYYYSSDQSSPDYYRFQWVEEGMPTPSNWDGPYNTGNRRLISSSERDDAKRGVYSRRYTDNVIYQLESWTNPDHTLGLKYSESFQNNSSNSDFDPDDDQYSYGDRQELTQPMALYARDYDNEYRAGVEGAPRHSRWALLYDGVEAFLNVLDVTDQEELVSLVTFNNQARLDFNLQKSTEDDGQAPYIAEGYPNIRRVIAGITPDGGTAVGDGMLEGLPPLIPSDDSQSLARPFAAKTIVVLTDGVSNSGTNPGEAVSEIVGEANVTIHTVTFTPGADQSAMQAVADAGHGRHYHDDDGSRLVAIFEEIANNLPTILTE